PATSAPASAPEPPPSDLKVVTAYTTGAQTFQNTVYIKGARQRVEFPGMVAIDQCDLQRRILLRPAERRYVVEPYGARPQPPDPAAPPPPAPGPAGQPRGGLVVLATTITDTQERQTLFGLEARRIRTVVVKQVEGEACDRTPMRTEVDGWYVDLPTGAACQPPAVPEPPSGQTECRDRIEARVTGTGKLGFPVRLVSTVTTGEGGNAQVTTTQTDVVSLEATRLDPALFEIPPGYAAVSSATELVPAVSAGASLQEALFGSTADGTAAAAPKRPGVVRIGVLEPVNRSPRAMNTQMLRQELVGRVSSSARLEALPLAGHSAADVEAEAKRLECDYILLAEIAEIKTSKAGGLGGILRAAASGGPPKEAHEIKIAYRLYETAATSAPRASGEVKASSGKFGVGSALRLAAFAGQMYAAVGMMRAMRGYGLGLPGFDALSLLSQAGGFGGVGQAYYDPRAMVAGSIVTSLAAGGLAGMPSDPSQAELYRTASEALEEVAKAAAQKIRPAK
ncbi:MAG TPA: hypothetical protein VNI83_14270, partial [Vicinamibacterales bacterium]|nr:hypothetical protein [Vicinamibacterales bacterium]